MWIIMWIIKLRFKITKGYADKMKMCQQSE
ncbi:MAG: hypothetical protein ETSY2_25745 [Candidatus Entotheonella gemina]|uniref:Uncharacterized protein n=1 Tax=Candidatus Entotheonella gemina TaxID=1429439 RepID=W4M4V6_9BACT|nr:MAG: hypothetical protein ETSY2_25745 [Candidatus Entotheonella gemina]